MRMVACGWLAPGSRALAGVPKGCTPAGHPSRAGRDRREGHGRSGPRAARVAGAAGAGVPGGAGRWGHGGCLRWRPELDRGGAGPAAAAPRLVRGGLCSHRRHMGRPCWGSGRLPAAPVPRGGLCSGWPPAGQAGGGPGPVQVNCGRAPRGRCCHTVLSMFQCQGAAQLEF